MIFGVVTVFVSVCYVLYLYLCYVKQLNFFSSVCPCGNWKTSDQKLLQHGTNVLWWTKKVFRFGYIWPWALTLRAVLVFLARPLPERERSKAVLWVHLSPTGLSGWSLVHSANTWELKLVCHVGHPLPSARQHPSYRDCLEVKREYYQNCSVLGCVTQCLQPAAHLYEQFLQAQQIGFVTLGPLHVRRGSCLELYYCNMVE